MDLGTSILIAMGAYIVWDAIKVAIQFTWQMTIEAQRHREEIEAAKNVPTDFNVNARMQGSAKP